MYKTLFLAVCCLLTLQLQAQNTPVKPSTTQKPQLNNAPRPTDAQNPKSSVIIVQPDSAKYSTGTDTLTNQEKRQLERRKRQNDLGSLEDKLLYNGSLSLQFGNSFLFFISPAVGYKIGNRFSAGPGFTYMYLGNHAVSYQLYGAKVFARLLVHELFFIHTEYEALSVPRVLASNYQAGQQAEGRILIPTLFVGPAYRQMIGEKSSIDLMLLANLQNQYYSIYSNPTLRVAFTTGW